MAFSLLKRSRKPTESVWAIGLHAACPEPPPASVYRASFERLDSALRALKAPATHVAVDGEGYTQRSTEYGGRLMQRVVAADFAGITGISLEALIDGAAHPHATLAFASLDWMDWPEPGELSLVLSAQDSLITLGSPRLRELILGLLAWRPWCYGYALHDKAERDPAMRLMGGNPGTLTKAEDETDEVWHEASLSERQSRLRGVYPVLVVNERLELELELPRFRGHLTIGSRSSRERSPHGKDETPLPAGVPRRSGAPGAQQRPASERDRQRSRLLAREPAPLGQADADRRRRG